MSNKPDSSDEIYAHDRRQANFYFILAIICLLVPYIIPQSASYQGKFIVASEHLNDGIFDETVIYLLKHNEGGAMGVIVNQPERVVPVKEFLEENGTLPFLGRMASYRAGYSIEPELWSETRLIGTASAFNHRERLARPSLNLSSRVLEELTIYSGGPVFDDHYYILYPTELLQENSTKTDGMPYALTRNITVLNQIIWHEKERPFKIFRGISSWGAGQLDQEIKQGKWHVVKYNEQILFNHEPNLIWVMIQKMLN